MQKYINDNIAELATELCSGVVRLRKEFVKRTESLLTVVDPREEYPLDFVTFKITEYRSSGGGKQPLIPGKELIKDLLSLIMDVCESFEFSTSDCDDQVFDTPGLAEHFNVSTKTIQRWRKRGLPARRMVFPDGRKRVCFLAKTAEKFAEKFGEKIKRSSNFSQMSPAEKREILRRARRMVSFADASLMDVSRRIAKKTSRAVETIRYTIRNHDNATPNEAIFPKLLNTLTREEKQKIYQLFLTGTSAKDLAETYGRTRGSIHRIVNEVRALQLLERPISYVFNELFDDSGVEDDMVKMAKIGEQDANKMPTPSNDLPEYLRNLYKVPLLSAAQEKAMFFLYNYYKYKADELRQKIDPTHILAHQIKKVESLLLEANVVKNSIIKANLRLVVSIAKKHLSGPMNLFELVSDGNIALMRAVEKFDISKGFRFSTYASWAIIRNYARSVPKEQTQLSRFSTGHEEILDIAASLRNYDPSQNNIEEMRESISAMLNNLSPRERTILIDHYGLDDEGKTKTFEQLGKTLGISKERVRQIEIQALEKLRDIAGPHQE